MAFWTRWTTRSPSVESLIADLVDEDGDVRKSAARMLGKLGDSRAIEPLSVVCWFRLAAVNWKVIA
jgi:hypothetical protein